MKLGVTIESGAGRKVPAPQVAPRARQRKTLPVIPCDPTPSLAAFGAPVPVEQIASPESRFRCVPYASVIAARDCVKRQAVASGSLSPEERTSTGGARSWVTGGGGGFLRAQFGRCRDCELGRAVQRRLVS